MKTTDTLLVSYDFSHGEDIAVLVIGRKSPGKPVDIVNAFQGEEAVELYKRLTERKENKG